MLLSCIKQKFFFENSFVLHENILHLNKFFIWSLLNLFIIVREGKLDKVQKVFKLKLLKLN